MEDQVQDNGEEQTLEEQYQELDETVKSEMVRFNKKTIDFAKRNAKGESIPIEETKLHVEHQKLISQLERSRNQIFKMLSPKDKKSMSDYNGEDKPDIDRIISMPNSVSAIIKKLKTG